MSRTAAEMVDLYTEAIARKLDPTLGDGYAKTSDSGGINVESFSLDELEAGLQKWQAKALVETTGSSIQFSTLTTIPVGSTECDDE